MKELMKLSKRELINTMSGLIQSNKSLASHNICKQLAIRHTRNRLLKIRNELDYLLKHPYSRDSGMSTWKHSRDKPIKLSQSKFKSAKHNK